MSNITNTVPIEVSQEAKESEQRQALSDFNELGERSLGENNGILETTTLENILKYTHPKDINDKDFDSQIEYRYQYTLETLLETINPTKESQKFEGDDQLRRNNAIKILTSAYPELLEKRPESALIIAQAMYQRLTDKETLSTTPQDPYHPDHAKTLGVRETRALFGFFNVASNIPYQQTKEITVNTFTTLFNNYPKTDYMSYDDVIAILGNYLDSPLFGTLSKMLFTTAKTLDSSNHEDQKKLEAVSYLYKHLIKTPLDLSTKEKIKLNNTLFKQSMDRVHTEQNPNTKKDFLWVLWAFVNTDKQWSGDKQLLKQETDFHLQILKTVTNSLRNKSAKAFTKEHKDSDADTQIKHYFISILGELLEQYVKYSGNSENNWFEIAKKHDENFKQALQTYLYVFSTNNDKSLKDEMFKKLEVIINFKEIENPKHPFHNEGILFYAEYSFARAKELEARSKEVLNKAEGTINK